MILRPPRFQLLQVPALPVGHRALGAEVVVSDPGFVENGRNWHRTRSCDTMRVRDSGMPEESYWETLLNVPLTITRFDLRQYRDVAEFGCGYGTFSIPVAKAIRGTLYTYDIDPAMVQRTRERGTGLAVVCEQRDVMESGFGVRVDAVLLFNILHCDQPRDLLRYAADAAPHILVTHWKHDDTPRGPSLDIRPRPEQVAEWAAQLGLQVSELIELPPWHYGMRLSTGEGLSSGQQG